MVRKKPLVFTTVEQLFLKKSDCFEEIRQKSNMSKWIVSNSVARNKNNSAKVPLN